VTIRNVKKAEYSYYHEDGEYTVVSDGQSVVAVSNVDYGFY
jgi:hypothetical protein